MSRSVKLLLRSALIAILFVFTLTGKVSATPITDILFVRDLGTGPQLESVGFDGTSFIGFSTVLEPLSRDFSAMSYDP
jgi:hypothetical protein